MTNDILSKRTDPKLRIRMDEVTAEITATRCLAAADCRFAVSRLISSIVIVKVSKEVVSGIVEFKLFNEKPSLIVVFSKESSSFEMVGFGVVNVSTVVLITDS